jgi:hypothetical protein
MKIHRLSLAALVLLTAVALPAAAPGGATEVRHGADAAFRTASLGICWGIIPAAQSGVLDVVTRIRVLDPGKNPFRSFAVKAVHPFTGATEWISPRQALKEVNDVVSAREAFKAMGGRQMLFFKAASGPADQAPDLMVDYLGIPDTAPQLADRQALEAYFKIAFARLMKP